MYTRTDTITSYFLCLLGHMAVLITIVFSQENVLKNSLIGDSNIAEESRTGFTVSLIFPVLSTLGEFFLMCRKVTTVRLSLFSQLCHTIATGLLLLFFIDAHPPAHFWLLFFLLSIPPLAVSIYSYFSITKK